MSNMCAYGGPLGRHKPLCISIFAVLVELKMRRYTDFNVVNHSNLHQVLTVKVCFVETIA